MTAAPLGGLGSVQSVQQVDVSGLDLETAMLAVQSNRANVLEDQLKDQMKAVQAKNEQINTLNKYMSVLQGALQTAPGSATTETKVPLTKEQRQEVLDACKALGIDPPEELGGKMQWEVTLRDGTKILVDENGKKEAEDYKKRNWAFRSSDYSGKKGITSIVEKMPEPTKGQLEKLVTNAKAQIDGLSNSQQMDMLRLQSLSNKRNEAFDLMSNWIKKMQDSRSSIIGNMR